VETELQTGNEVKMEWVFLLIYSQIKY